MLNNFISNIKGISILLILTLLLVPIGNNILIDKNEQRLRVTYVPSSLWRRLMAGCS